MQSRFSLLLLSMLFAAGCVHDRFVTRSNQHFGEIVAPCAGKTVENCPITRDLDAIEECDYVENGCAGGNKLLNDLFGETRHTKFANYVVFFDQDHTPGTFQHPQFGQTNHAAPEQRGWPEDDARPVGVRLVSAER